MSSNLKRQSISDMKNSSNMLEKNPFISYSPYWLKANFITDEYFLSN